MIIAPPLALAIALSLDKNKTRPRGQAAAVYPSPGDDANPASPARRAAPTAGPSGVATGRRTASTRRLVLPALVLATVAAGCGAAAGSAPGAAPGTASPAAGASAPAAGTALTVRVDRTAGRLEVTARVTGPAELQGGCRPTLSAELVAPSGAVVVPTPAPPGTLHCLAITVISVPQGESREFTTWLPLPGTHGVYTVRGHLAGGGDTPAATVSV